MLYFSICFWGGSLVVIIGCGNILSLKLYVISMSLSTVFVLTAVVVVVVNVNLGFKHSVHEVFCG